MNAAAAAAAAAAAELLLVFCWFNWLKLFDDVEFEEEEDDEDDDEEEGEDVTDDAFVKGGKCAEFWLIDDGEADADEFDEDGECILGAVGFRFKLLLLLFE